MLDSVDRILQQYEISHYGFLPIDEPLSCLPDIYYRPWEDLIAQLPELIARKHFYEEVEKLPFLDTNKLHSIPEWRRAYVVLTFLMHAYVWSGDTPHEILPPNIAIPLLAVSNRLGLPPTATYPALNLWNCGLVTDIADITNPENVIMRHTFTGTSDEAWFYAVSVSVEAKGVNAIQTMLECITAIDTKNHTKILTCLTSFANIVIDLGAILQRMHDHCDPRVFYHRIRPFLAGSRGMEKAGLPNGIFYDEGHGKGSWRQYSGGSNAQSTLVQFLDIALGVRHEAPGADVIAEAKRQTYLDEMRQYMPVSHRQFLEHFAAIANIRQYATSLSATSDISAAFDKAVDALTSFRDIHIRIVARYIIAPSRKAQSGGGGHSEQRQRSDSESQAVNIASASSRMEMKNDLKGTGGTNLIAFLKQTRDETRAARVPVAQPVKA